MEKCVFCTTFLLEWTEKIRNDNLLIIGYYASDEIEMGLIMNVRTRL